MSKKLDLVTLNALAKQVNQHHESVISAGQTALERAQLCGQALAQAKELIPHGGWIDWLGKNCEGISECTAQRYMKLAKYCTVRDLESVKTITQVYLAAGIIKEKGAESKPPDQPKSEAEQLKCVADAYVASGSISLPAESTPAGEIGNPISQSPSEPAEPVSHVEQSPTAPETFGLSSQFVQGCLIDIKAHNNASVSFLQRHFRLGYSKAAAVIHELERLGHIGPALGTEPRVIYEAETPPSPSDMKLQDPIPGAPMGTGVSGGEISNHPLGPLVRLVMDEITRLGEGYAVSNLLVLSPIFQYGRCRGVEGL